MVNEVERKDILSSSQASFRKYKITNDLTFTLFNLIKKALSKGKYLLTCSADFQKVYDSIC